MLGQLFDLARAGARSILRNSAGNMPPVEDAIDGGTVPPMRVPNVTSSHLTGRNGLAAFSTAQWAGGIGPTLQLAPLAIPKRAALKYGNTESKSATSVKVPAVFIPGDL